MKKTYIIINQQLITSFINAMKNKIIIFKILNTRIM